MKVIVTGGSGFIGKNLVEDLQQQNHEIVIIDKNIDESQRNKFKTYEIDVASNLTEIFSIEKPDAVLHLAAQTMLRKSMDDPIEDAISNIIGTIQVLEACKNTNTKRLIYTSTGGARYGSKVRLPASESEKTFPESPYGISKHSAEHYVQMYAHQHAIDATILCFGNVYGPGDDPAFGRVVTVFIDKFVKGESPVVFGDGLQTRDFVYVKDLTRFITRILPTPTPSLLYNISSGTQTPIMEVYDIIKQIRLEAIKAVHAPAIKGEVRDIVLDITKARNELGWEATTSMKDGIKATVDDYIAKRSP